MSLQAHQNAQPCNINSDDTTRQRGMGRVWGRWQANVWGVGKGARGPGTRLPAARSPNQPVVVVGGGGWEKGCGRRKGAATG